MISYAEACFLERAVVTYLENNRSRAGVTLRERGVSPPWPPTVTLRESRRVPTRASGQRRVFEIGFNAGASAALFLTAHPDIHVTSVDIGDHACVLPCKRIIDDMFPGRHTLIIGDSVTTVPQLLPYFAGRFDIAFVDGGHVPPVPAIDCIHALDLLCPSGLLIVDDYCEAHGWEGVIATYDRLHTAGCVDTVCVWHCDDRGLALGNKLRGATEAERVEWTRSPALKPIHAA